MQTFMAVHFRWDIYNLWEFFLLYLHLVLELYFSKYLLFIVESILSKNISNWVPLENLTFLGHQSTHCYHQSLPYRCFFRQKDIFHQVHLMLFLKGNEVERSCSILTDTATKPHQMGKRRQTYAATHFISVSSNWHKSFNAVFQGVDIHYWNKLGEMACTFIHSAIISVCLYKLKQQQ